MLLVVADVVLRHGLGVSLVGTVDFVELCLVGLIAIALPATLLRDEIIVVDVIDTMVGRRAQRTLRFVGLVVTLVFVTAMGVQMIEPALDSISFGDVTSTLSIPKYVHWGILILGVFASTAALVVMVVLAFGGDRADR